MMMKRDIKIWINWDSCEPGYLSRYSDWLQATRSGDWITVLGRISATVQTGYGAHPTSYTVGTESIPEVKRPGLGVYHPLPSSVEVEETVELYLYCTSETTWPVIGWNLPLHLPLTLPLTLRLPLPLPVNWYRTPCDYCDLMTFVCLTLPVIRTKPIHTRPCGIQQHRSRSQGRLPVRKTRGRTSSEAVIEIQRASAVGLLRYNTKLYTALYSHNMQQYNITVTYTHTASDCFIVK
jgi:hypothetical protein